MTSLKYWDAVAGEHKYVTVPLVGQPVRTFTGRADVSVTPSDTGWYDFALAYVGGVTNASLVIHAHSYCDIPNGSTSVTGISLWYSTDSGSTWTLVDDSTAYGGADRQAGVRVQREGLSVSGHLANVTSPDLRIMLRVRETLASGGWPGFHGGSITGMVFEANPVLLDNRYERATEPWQTPTMENGWEHYGAPYTVPAYRKEGSSVRLKGMIRNGTVNQQAFTLPAGYRPTERLILPATSANAFGEIRIYESGFVVPYTPTVNTWVSLDGITFQAEQ